MQWLPLALVALTARGTTAEAPTATIASGIVVGTTTQYAGATATNNKFLGIPFAKSPPLRFGLPEPPAKWTNPLDATTYRPGCVQQNSSPGIAANESEDCLYLNVFTPPGTQAGAGKPVMFWIYGGNLQTGMASDPTFDGSSFAANQDVVVVTTNYRLNAFGFSSSPAIQANQQNVGFYDQRFALSWVQANIEAFGGDPDKVTIFGESAGGYSVKFLVVRPPSALPFRAAIMESQGTVIDGSGPQSWNTLVQKLGCGSGDDGAALACLRSRDAALVKAVVANNSLGFPPTDDDTTFINDFEIANSFAAHKVAPVPVLIGTNDQELSPITYSLGLNGVQLTALVNQLTSALPALSSLLDPILTNVLTEDAAYELLTTVLTDIVFQCPAARFAAQSRDADHPTWRYLYNASFPNTTPFPGAGAYHSAELTTVFGTYPRAGATPQQKGLSAYMQHAWAAFAKAPAGGPGWPAYGADEAVGDLGADGSAGEGTIRAAEIDQLCPLAGGVDVLGDELQGVQGASGSDVGSGNAALGARVRALLAGAPS